MGTGKSCFLVDRSNTLFDCSISIPFPPKSDIINTSPFKNGNNHLKMEIEKRVLSCEISRM